MEAKYCVKCGRGVSQNYCPQCGGTKFSPRPPDMSVTCGRCGKTTTKSWTCSGCNRRICEECIRSYKYLTTLCIDCFKIQTETSGAKPQPLEEGAELKAQEMEEEPGEGSQIEVIEQEERPSLFDRIRLAFGRAPR